MGRRTARRVEKTGSKPPISKYRAKQFIPLEGANGRPKTEKAEGAAQRKDAPRFPTGDDSGTKTRTFDGTVVRARPGENYVFVRDENHNTVYVACALFSADSAPPDVGGRIRGISTIRPEPGQKHPKAIRILSVE